LTPSFTSVCTRLSAPFIGFLLDVNVDNGKHIASPDAHLTLTTQVPMHASHVARDSVP